MELLIKKRVGIYLLRCFLFIGQFRLLGCLAGCLVFRQFQPGCLVFGLFIKKRVPGNQGRTQELYRVGETDPDEDKRAREEKEAKNGETFAK